jgi:hypothetical protein
MHDPPIYLGTFGLLYVFPLFEVASLLKPAGIPAPGGAGISGIPVATLRRVRSLRSQREYQYVAIPAGAGVRLTRHGFVNFVLT